MKLLPSLALLLALISAAAGAEADLWDGAQDEGTHAALSGGKVR